MYISSFNHELSPDLIALRDSVRQFAQKEIAPYAQDFDKANHFPLELWRKMGDLGILGMTVAEEYGGVNMGYLAHVIASEDFSCICGCWLVLRRAFKLVREPIELERY